MIGQILENMAKEKEMKQKQDQNKLSNSNLHNVE